MVDILLKIILLLSPITYTTGISLDKFDLIFFRLAVASLFIASLFDKPKRTFEIRPLAFLLIIGLINVFWHNFHPIVMTSFVNLFSAGIALYIIVVYCDKPKEIYKYMIYATIVNIVFFILQRIGYNPILKEGLKIGQEGGIMGNAPRLISYLALVLPFTFSLNPIIFVISIIISFLTKEYSLLGIVLIFLFISNRDNWPRRILFISIGALAIFLLRAEIISSLKMRLDVWIPVLNSFFNRPLLGYGLGMFPSISDQIVKIKNLYQVDYVFNSYLQFIFGTGILGLVWLGYLGKKLINKINLNDTESLAIVGLAVLSLIEYPFEIPRLWLTIIAITCFFIIKKGEINVSS